MSYFDPDFSPKLGEMYSFEMIVELRMLSIVWTACVT